MTRRVLLLGVLLGAALSAPRQARAQGPVVFYLGAQGDTATGAVPGTEIQIPVRSINPWYYYYYNNSVASATLTFVFDTAKVQVLGVEPLGSGLYSINSTVAGPGTLTVSASGYAYGYDAELYALRLKLKPGATDGSYLWIKSDSAALCYYYYCYYYGTHYKQAVSAIGQICHATEMWGDVDGNFQVDSRDALITLSAAVGLSVNGFNLAQGDVDGDGLTNSRDALMMLSFAINLPVASNARVGVGLPDACPGLTAPGDSVVFQRRDYSGLAYLGGFSTVPAAIPGATNAASSDGGGARLAVDGRSVVYMCSEHGGQQICRVDADTGGVVILTYDSLLTDASPDWSPSGDSIVYLKNGVIWKMAADGSGQTQVGGSPISAVSVQWGRDSTKLGYVNGALHVANTDGIGDVMVTTGFGDIQGFRWSAAGDSIIFGRQSDNRTWVVPTAGGTPGIVVGFAGNSSGGDWGSRGIIFSLDPGNDSPPSVWLIRGVTGPIFRITRPTIFDRGPSWRRNP